MLMLTLVSVALALDLPLPLGASSAKSSSAREQRGGDFLLDLEERMDVSGLGRVALVITSLDTDATRPLTTTWPTPSCPGRR